MNRLTKWLAALVLLLVPVGVAQAQAAITYTTLSSAVTGGGGYSGFGTKTFQTSVTLASLTNVNAAVNGSVQTIIEVDDEAMGVLSVNSTTNVVQVLRGYNGSIANPHNSGAPVMVGPTNYFYAVNPSGACNLTGTVVTPYINLITGQQWLCDTTTSTWTPELSTGSITPSATSAAIQTVGQTFTVNGLQTGEPLIVTVQPAPTSLCPLTSVRVTAANTITLYFTVLTAAACTPASGVYEFFDPLRNMSW